MAPGQVVAVVGWGRTWRRSQSKKLKVVRGNSIGNRHVSKKTNFYQAYMVEDRKNDSSCKKDMLELGLEVLLFFV